MRYINKISVMVAASGLLAATSCTDFSDYNTAPELSSSATGEKTLWQNISENSDLSKFAEIVKAADYVSTLDAPGFYTLFAPLNGTYNADSVLAILAVEKDTDRVVKEFIKQHVLAYNYPVNAALEDQKVMSVNAKTHLLTQKGYGDATFTNNINLPASNGLFHIMNGKEGFYTNVYEYFSKIEGCDLFRDYVQKYDEQYIDMSNSILGPVINGVQEYEYIEYKHRNSVISGRDMLNASLDNEDSTYTVLFPNDEAWTKSYDRVRADYNYIPKISYMDLSSSAVSGYAKDMNATAGKTDCVVQSTQEATEYLADSLTKRQMVINLALSHGYPENDVLLTGGGEKTDSVLSSRRNRLVSAKDIEDHTVKTFRMSNGYARVVDSIPYQPWQTFEPVLYGIVGRPYRGIEASGRALKTLFLTGDTENENDTMFKYVPEYFKERMIGEKSSTSRYFSFESVVPTGSAVAPEVDFALPDVLSTTYHIYVVTLPSQILDIENYPQNDRTPLKPYYLSFYLNYTNAENTQVKQQLYLSDDADPAWGPYMEETGNTPATKVKHIVTKPGYIQVIDLGEVTFPICYYNQDAYPSLMMCHTQTFNSKAKRNSYEQTLRVAGVYLVPVEADKHFIHTQKAPTPSTEE